MRTRLVLAALPVDLVGGRTAKGSFVFTPTK